MKKLGTVIWVALAAAILTLGNAWYWTLDGKPDGIGQPFMLYETRCGTVLDISTQLVAVKHGTNTDYYISVDFDEGEDGAHKVTAETFYSTKPGDRICLEVSRRDFGFLTGIGMVVVFVIDIFIFLCSCVFVIYLMASFIGWSAKRLNRRDLPPGYTYEGVKDLGAGPVHICRRPHSVAGSHSIVEKTWRKMLDQAWDEYKN